MSERVDLGAISKQFRDEQMARKSVSTALISQENEYNGTHPYANSDGDLWGKQSETNPGNSADIQARNAQLIKNTLYNKNNEYNASSIKS